jgi:hypothetical protein
VQKTVVVCICKSEMGWDGNKSVRLAKPEGNGEG